MCKFVVATAENSETIRRKRGRRRRRFVTPRPGATLVKIPDENHKLKEAKQN
jgi:hypothetical protein